MSQAPWSARACFKLGKMLDVTRPGHGGAVRAVRTEVQYESPKKVADQHIWVHDGDGHGRLPCYASRPLGEPGPDVERLIVVVHGALRDSDRYFAHAGDVAREAGSTALIVAPQFLADVDIDVLGHAAGDVLAAAKTREIMFGAG
jgi:hypothetical protein